MNLRSTAAWAERGLGLSDRLLAMLPPTPSTIHVTAKISHLLMGTLPIQNVLIACACVCMRAHVGLTCRMYIILAILENNHPCLGQTPEAVSYLPWELEESEGSVPRAGVLDETEQLSQMEPVNPVTGCLEENSESSISASFGN